MKGVWRAVIEAGFMIFLFYSNLLMGEFERSGIGRSKGFVWAIGDIFTGANCAVAVIAALIGYVLVARNSNEGSWQFGAGSASKPLEATE